VLVIGAICFAVWALLAAPSMLRSAQASPLGLRRTIALAALRPISRLRAMVGLTDIQARAYAALGLDGRLAPPGTAAPSPRELTPVAPRSPAQTGTYPIYTGGPGTGKRPTWGGGEPAVSPLPILPRPTKADPLRVLIVGDSLGIDMGEGLAGRLAANGAFVSRLDARVSTGLARPDYFNWPAQVARDLNGFRPDVVVAMFGVNDGQSLLVNGRQLSVGSAAWRAAYGRRAAQMMGLVTANGRPLIWVGVPPMASRILSQNMQTIDAIVRAQAHAQPGVVFVDSWSLFANAQGHYSAYLRNASGREDLVRTPDGIHLTPAGDDRLATAVYQAMSTLWLHGG